MKAEVKEGKLVHIQGDEGNPDSQGFLCVRGRAAEEIIGNDQRLLYPLARDSRESQDWRRVSWDDVLDRIANAMANAGGNRVGIWPGHGNGSNDYAVGVKSQLINRFAKMFGAQLIECELSNIDFTDAKLEKCGFIKTNLEGANFENCSALQCNFLEAKLPRAKFSGAELEQTIWRDADLSDANFSRCNLEATNFENAVLKNAVLSEARLVFGNFTGADFTDAEVTNCDLYMAKLDRIVEENTNWSQSKRRRAQKPDHERNRAEEWPTARKLETC